MKQTFLEFAMSTAIAVGIMAVLIHCSGCNLTPAQNLENAAAVAQYKLELADCRKQGKEAKSYAVYERCADEIDARLCRESSLRCTDGGR